ncbi:hypothetical protein HCB17_20870 [Salinispora arenicola]|nr:hypothetical protein [Salinispora arenicola]
MCSTSAFLVQYSAEVINHAMRQPQPPRHRPPLTLAGSLAGLLTIALLAVLATAYSHDAAMTAGMGTLMLADALLGVASCALLVAGHIRRWIDEAGDIRWWCGYSAAVKDLTDRGVLPMSADRG